jgi:hypothetical protein
MQTSCKISQRPVVLAVSAIAGRYSGFGTLVVDGPHG